LLLDAEQERLQHCKWLYTKLNGQRTHVCSPWTRCGPTEEALSGVILEKYLEEQGDSIRDTRVHLLMYEWKEGSKRPEDTSIYP
jgi:hypothetical protein